MSKKKFFYVGLIGLLGGFAMVLPNLQNARTYIEVNAATTHVQEEVDDVNTYYESVRGLKGDELLNGLRAINSSERQRMVGYKSLGEYFKETDYDPHNPNNLIGFYSGTSAAFDGSWGTFNREHVWPDSRGGGRIDGDIHMTRPTLGYQNGSRGNSFYVEGKKTSDVGWDPAMETWGDEKYRGIAARIIFYGPIASDILSLVDVEDDLESNNTMGKLSDLLRWNEAYPIDWSEIQRNEAANLIQGNRNPFIDHPEFANIGV